jgi:hypothetical protein
MDGQRFDRYTRAFATAAHRRAALKGALAGALALAIGGPRQPTTLAQQNVPLGGRCSAAGASSECSQAGTPTGGVAVVCGDNGVSRDGSFNCCRNAGGVCSQDFHCCGGAFCTNGVCGGSSSASGLALGASCTSTSQCAQTGGSVVCADNGVAEDGARNCCRNTGGACRSDLECCAGALCINGRCGGSGTTDSSSNLAPGAACTSSSQCSQVGGAVVCGNNGYDTDGALNCCRNEGGACRDTVFSADCCGGFYCREGRCTQTTTDGLNALGVRCTAPDQCSQDGGAVACADNGVESDGALNCCRFDGGACQSDAHCCIGLLCINGTCGGTTPAAGSGSLGLGAACAGVEECSQAGGAVACADNGIASDGALNCCRFQGGACANGAGCCAGLECVGGVCGGAGSAGSNEGGTTPVGSGLVGLGGECTADDQCSQEGGAVACRDNGLPSDGERNCCRYTGGACFGDSGCCAGLACVSGTCQG